MRRTLDETKFINGVIVFLLDIHFETVAEILFRQGHLRLPTVLEFA